MKNKVTIAVEMKMHCAGCGSLFFVRNMLEPIVFEDEKIAWNVIKHAKHQLDNASCNECTKTMTGIDYYKVRE